VPGTPPSVTCSVHSDPDQYLFSCRPVGSVSQPGAIPVNVILSGAPSTASDACPRAEAPVNELLGPDIPEGSRRRR
jgi:hypothetical protein